MSVMITGRMLTLEDLDALPDDGLRHELIDGTLVMTPAPGTAHQRMALGLAVALREALVGTDLEVLIAPFDVILGASVVQPDLIVAKRVDLTERGLPASPVLAVEVMSGSSGWLDLGRKRSLYEEHGVASYWLVDPSEPSLTILELRDGRYEEAAVASGDRPTEVNNPVPLTLNAAELAKG